jgi:hypothetical protein
VKKEFVVERDGRSFVLYAGLLDLAHERGLKSITTTLVQVPGELNGMMAIVHATVEMEQGTFTGLGDACPTNVTRMMAPHLIRMAETRAKARALRDAVNVGVTAFEELSDEVAEDAPQGGRRLGGGDAPGGRRDLRPLEEEEGLEADGPEAPLRTPAPAGGRAETLRLGLSSGSADGAAGRAAGSNAAGATPKQLQTIARMARAAGKTIETEGISRAQASEIISSLIGEMGQLRAS